MSRPASSVAYDPYRGCTERCVHDLAPAVLVTDLLGEDGPFPPIHLIRYAELGQIADSAEESTDPAA